MQSTGRQVKVVWCGVVEEREGVKRGKGEKTKLQKIGWSEVCRGVRDDGWGSGGATSAVLCSLPCEMGFLL